MQYLKIYLKIAIKKEETKRIIFLDPYFMRPKTWDKDFSRKKPKSIISNILYILNSNLFICIRIAPLSLLSKSMIEKYTNSK